MWYEPAVFRPWIIFLFLTVVLDGYARTVFSTCKLVGGEARVSAHVRSFHDGTREPEEWDGELAVEGFYPWWYTRTIAATAGAGIGAAVTGGLMRLGVADER